MDDSSSSPPALQKRPGDEGADRSPPEKRPCMEPVPEDLLYDCDDLGEEPLPCFAFDEAQVREVIRELEETIKGPTLSATTTRTDDLSGPLVSVAGSSVMANVDVGHALQLFHGGAIGFPPVSFDGGNSVEASVDAATACSDDSSGGGGTGAAATGSVGEERENGEEEEWLTRVLSGPLLEFEEGFLDFRVEP